MEMANRRAIPIRLGDELIARLDKTAESIGTTRAALIRLLIQTWLEEFEEKGGVVLPPNWEQMLRDDHNIIFSRIQRVAEDPGKYDAKKTND